MLVGLDIGAGSKKFAKDLKSDNPDLEMLIFCGEPSWKTRFFKPIKTKDEAEKLIKEKTTGIYLLDDSRYTHFNLPDNSIDFVTINSPDPLSLVSNNYKYSFYVEKELERCLKKGGILFFGHSTFITLELPENYEVTTQGTYENTCPFNLYHIEKADLSKNLKIPKHLPKIYPTSPVILSNIKEKGRQNAGIPNLSGQEYWYNMISLYPNYKVWVKN